MWARAQPITIIYIVIYFENPELTWGQFFLFGLLTLTWPDLQVRVAVRRSGQVSGHFGQLCVYSCSIILIYSTSNFNYGINGLITNIVINHHYDTRTDYFKYLLVFQFNSQILQTIEIIYIAFRLILYKSHKLITLKSLQTPYAFNTPSLPLSWLSNLLRVTYVKEYAIKFISCRKYLQNLECGVWQRMLFIAQNVRIFCARLTYLESRSVHTAIRYYCRC